MYMENFMDIDSKVKGAKWEDPQLSNDIKA